MEQIVLIRKDGTEVKLNSTSPIRFINSAGQQSDLMSVDTVKLIIKSADLIEFGIGDKIRIVTDEYSIRSTSTREIVSENEFVYDVTFYGVIYELMKSQYRDTDINGNSTRASFDLTYELKDFVKVIIYNTNRDFPGKWAFDYNNCPATEPRTIAFSKQNCLQVLQTVCKEFGYDFAIRQHNGIRTIKIGTLGTVVSPPGDHTHFEYGKGNGLYNLKEKKVDDQAIVTRLWIEGGTQNIKSDYRNYSDRLQLPLRRKNKNAHTLYDGTVIPANSEYIGITDDVKRYIEDAALANIIGTNEETEHYDHMHPQRTGTVTALGGDIYSFIDNTMNFDLNEKDGSGNTLYLVNGVSAKINFITGKLAGMQFELSAYNADTKTFKLIKYTDERGLSFPSEGNTAFRITAGDRYRITDINLPQSYIDDAEEELWYAGYNDFLMRKQARVQYELTFDAQYFENSLPPDSETVIFRPGDYVPIKDERFGIEKNMRIVSVKRDLLKDHDYSLTLSDSTSISVITETVQDVLEHNTIIERNRLRDFTKARTGWRTTEELRNMIYDPDGYFDSGNIKPESIDTAMLSVGVKSQQFILSGVVMQANTNGNPNRFDASSGVLAHLTIDENDVRLWNMASITVNLTDSGGYYVFARCSKSGNTGTWYVTKQQMKVEEVSDQNNYYFQVGIIGSVQTPGNFRDFNTTYGFTRINGNTVTTGRIKSVDGKTYFDLDSGIIGGKIRFLSSGSETDLADWADGAAQDIQAAQGAANAAALAAQQAIDDAAANVGLINTEVGKLQAQIDGEVSNWFYPYSPTLANYPASDWTTNTIKDRHIGDTFTNTAQAPATDAGKSWRFVKNGTVYSWTQIADSDAVLALQKAAQAQSTADGKSTTYLIQPSSYKFGDMWVLAADTTVNGIAYKSGEILTATQDSTTYNQAHWVKKVRYTDDTAVNNIQIGGVNLIINSRLPEFLPNDVGMGARSSIKTEGGDEYYTYTPDAGKQLSLYGYLRLYPAGKQYTGGIFVRHSNSTAISVNLYISIIPSPYNGFKTTLVQPNVWTYIYLGIIGNPIGSHSGHIVITGDTGIPIDVKKIKLEEGNKPTAWDESPEDINLRINTAKQEALTAAGNAQTSANNANTAVGDLNTYVDGSFKDGVIEASEAKAIEKYINIVNTEKSNLEAIYNTLYTNTYLEGTPKTNLLNAKVTYFGAVDTLLASISTAITDGKTTTAEKQAVDSNYTSYKSALASLQTAIENANKAIQTKLDDLSTEKVNELEIGGRNLFILGDYNPVLSGGAYHHYINAEIGKQYTVSTNIPKTLTFDSWFDSEGVAASSSVNGFAINNPRTITATANRIYIAVRGTTQINGIKNGTYWVKVEKGSKATDWIPAIEDTSTAIERAQLKADGYMAFRYVRDWISGSTSNNNNIWGEIKVINKAGTNIALSKTPSANGTFETANPASNATDNNTTTYATIPNVSNVANYVQIDLGAINYDIDYIQVWHYPERTFYGTKTEISTDGVNWTPVFDSAKSGTYKETAAGNIISQRWNRVMDRLNEAEAKTKFQTLIDGGLIYTALMKLFDTLSGSETAFISGLQGANKNLPAFGAGGSYAEALSGLAKAVIYHNGKSKFTDTEIEGIIKAISGEIAGFNIIGKSLISGTMQFTNSAIETLSQLLTPSNVSITNQTSWTSSVQNNSAHAYTQNFTLPNDGILKFEASAEHTGSYLQGGWDVHIEDANGSVVFSDTGDSGILSKPYQVNLESGTYSIHVQSYVLAEAGQSFTNIASIFGESGSTTITIATFTNKTKIGNDGFFSFWGALNMLYYHATNGLTIRGTTDMPGVLLSGSVGLNGGFNTVWGAKKHASSTAIRNALGQYTVYHSAGHSDYSVQITSETSGRAFYVPTANKGTSSFVVYFTNLSGAAADANFSFQITGRNY